jgi:hypothetical protein
MLWTVHYFAHHKGVWEKRRNGTHPGPASYAARKAMMWFTLAIDADQAFSQVNRSSRKLFN